MEVDEDEVFCPEEISGPITKHNVCTYLMDLCALNFPNEFCDPVPGMTENDRKIGRQLYKVFMEIIKKANKSRKKKKVIVTSKKSKRRKTTTEIPEPDDVEEEKEVRFSRSKRMTVGKPIIVPHIPNSSFERDEEYLPPRAPSPTYVPPVGRKPVSDERKRQIVEAYKAHTHWKFKTLARHLLIRKSEVSTLDTVRRWATAIKRQKVPQSRKIQIINDYVYGKYLEALGDSERKKIRMTDYQEWAMEKYRELGGDFNFKASTGWALVFKEKYGIKGKRKKRVPKDSNNEENDEDNSKKRKKKKGKNKDKDIEEVELNTTDEYENNQINNNELQTAVNSINGYNNNGGENCNVAQMDVESFVTIGLESLFN